MTEKMAVQWAKLFTKLSLFVTLSLIGVILLSFSFPSIFNISHMVFDEIYPTGVIILQGISGLGLVYLFYSWRKIKTDFRLRYALVTHVPEIWIVQVQNATNRSKESWKLKKHGGHVDDLVYDELPLVHNYHCSPKS